MTVYSEKLLKLWSELEDTEAHHLEEERMAMEEREKNVILTIEPESVYKTREEDHWAKRKKPFPESLEFYDLLSACLTFLFKRKFKGDVHQFKEADYSSIGALDNFLDPYKVLEVFLWRCLISSLCLLNFALPPSSVRA